MIPKEIDENKDQVKHLLFYQVESLKDDYEDLEEKFYHLNLDFKDKNRLLEFLIRDFKKLAEEMKCLNVYLENRRIELKNKLNKEKDTVEYYPNGYCNGLSWNANEEDHSIKDENESEFCSLDADKNELLTNFQSLLRNYVQSLLDYKASKLDTFKQEVLKIESSDVGLSFIELVNSLNGDKLNDKIKNFVNYKRKLEEHLSKLKSQLKEEKERAEQFSERSPIDLDNLNKLNLEKLNLSKLDANDEDKNLNKNILEFKFALLKVEDNLTKLKKVQINLEKETSKYSNEKANIETRIDSLRNDERKLLRELRDADARIQELTSETVHNQKIIEQLKK